MSNINKEILTPVTEDVKKEIKSDHELIILDDDEEENLKIKEENNVNLNFEKIFLPEVLYESDSVETPFFDYNLYLNKHKDGNFRSNDANPFQVSESNIIEDNNKNISNDNQYKCVAQERNNYTYIQGRTHAYEGEENYVYTPLKSGLNESDYSCSKNAELDEIDDDVQFISDSESVKLETSIEEVPEVNYKLIEYRHYDGLKRLNKVDGLYLKKVVNYTYRPNKRNPDDDEDCKYKCPLCKRPKGFYTLEAVNNHLKFEHISVFRKNKLSNTDI